MERVVWPELSLNLSRLAFGCAPVMGRIGKRQALSAMALAYELGVTHFDVARSYGFGEAERILGSFISDKRDRVTIATKFGILPAQVGKLARLFKPAVRAARQRIPALAGAIRKTSGALLRRGYYHPKDAERSIETSLRELHTDVIDILFIHECSSSDDLKLDLATLLDRLKQQGKIRAWGLATPAQEIQRISQLLGKKPSVVQHSWGDARADLPGVHDPRRILHSAISLTAKLRRPDGSLLPAVVHWGTQQGLAEGSLNQRLATLALQAVFAADPQAVVLCSMFQPANIVSNVSALSAVDASLARSFGALVQSLIYTPASCRV